MSPAIMSSTPQTLSLSLLCSSASENFEMKLMLSVSISQFAIITAAVSGVSRMVVPVATTSQVSLFEKSGISHFLIASSDSFLSSSCVDIFKFLDG